MNKTKQFWALLKFQMTTKGLMWLAPVAFIPWFLMGSFPANYHPSLSLILPIQNLFLVGIFGLGLLAPEIAQRAGGANPAWSSGTEFLLTRAVDRPIVYRARVFFFYLLLLVMPLLVLVHSLEKPDLTASEYSAAARQECLENVPGSSLTAGPYKGSPPFLTIAGGNVLTEKWHLWMFIATALTVQAVLLLIQPLKHRAILFYCLFTPLILLPLFSIHSTIGFPMIERAFFFFAAHQLLFWMGTLALFVVGQLWCERRFCSQEQ